MVRASSCAGTLPRAQGPAVTVSGWKHRLQNPNIPRTKPLKESLSGETTLKSEHPGKIKIWFLTTREERLACRRAQ